MNRPDPAPKTGATANPGTPPEPPLPPAAGLLAGYTPHPGVANELLDADGRVRPVWTDFITRLNALPKAEIAQRFARGEQYLRDAGVRFRLYSGGPAQDRDWPLSHVPVLIGDAEWQTICAGLSQRADLLERVIADLYGPADLVRDGHLPAELVAENPNWLRPMVGITPPSGHWLHHLAFEIARSPDGSFMVLGDRTGAPSGAGFALENRMATTRIFADPFPRARLRRLAGFFAAFRGAMEAQAGEGRRIAILTPGPGNDTYYEQAYIARYLGLSLLEGEDLIVRDGRAMVRTVTGPEPLGLLWRRIDGAFTDPLELNETSRIGTPGLIGAFRRGTLGMINPPGSGVLETRAFMAFYPRLCERLLGVPLLMPNIATWWCGQPLERAYVQQNAARMMIGHALETHLPFAAEAQMALGGRLRDPAMAPAAGPLSDWIEAQGPRLVGQEAVTLSTAPALRDGALVPRPMTIRVFAARTPQGWAFMPGGYARIGQSDDPTALAMQSGGSVADVWVLADRPVKAESLVTTGRQAQAEPGILPARAADNLYWLGRYVERTEGAIRLLRAYHLRLAETGDPADPSLAALADFLGGLGLAPTPTAPVPEALTGGAGLMASARSAASKVRDRFAPDGWHALADLANTAARLGARVTPGDDAARAMSVLLRKISGFSGLVHENMYRHHGWCFLSLGRAQERADGTLMLVEAFAPPADSPKAVPGALEIALEAADSVMTHQRRYRFGPSRASVLDLLVLDAQNPRAVLHQIGQMRLNAAMLPRKADAAGGPGPDCTQTGADAPGAAPPTGGLTGFERALLVLDTTLRVADPADLPPPRLAELRAGLARLSSLLAARYFS